MARSRVADVGCGLQIRRVAANILNKQSRTLIRDGLPTWGFDQELTTPHHKRQIVKKCYTGSRNWADSLERLRRPKKYEICNMEC